MARKRDPRRDEALELFKNSSGSITNREIAEKLSVPEKTISAWKSRDKWNAVLQKKDCSTAKGDCSTTNKGGAPKGNKNAKGNKGGKAPPGNKNAVKTGEHETIFADMLTDEEKEIYSELSDDPFFILSDEIRLLKIRQRRMMKRVQEAEAGLDQKEIDCLYELRGRRQYIDSEKGGKKVPVNIPKMTITEKREKTVRKIEDILSIEDALTRVSNQLTKAIKQLNDLDLNKKKVELLDQQIKVNEVEISKHNKDTLKKNITVILND